VRYNKSLSVIEFIKIIDLSLIESFTD